MDQRTVAQRKQAREIRGYYERERSEYKRGEEITAHFSSTFQRHSFRHWIPVEMEERSEGRLETRHSIGLEAVCILRSILRNGWRADE
jgi:hypothetical protein